MAHIRESFPTTENGSGVGVPLSSVLEGDAAAAKNASPSLVAKDDSGNLIYLKTDAAGNLLTTHDGGGASQKAYGTTAGNLAVTTIAEIALDASSTYRGLSWNVACFRNTVFEIVAINDPGGTPVETVLSVILVGPGQYTATGMIPQALLSFASGATSPVLRLRGRNLNTTSEMHGTITTNKDAA